MKIAFFAPHLVNIGTRNTVLNLSKEFEKNGDEVHLLRTYKEWDKDGPGEIINLGGSVSNHIIDSDMGSFTFKKMILATDIFPRFVSYLSNRNPDVLITGLFGSVGIGAEMMVGNDITTVVNINGYPRNSCLRSILWPRLYPRADFIVAPVKGVGERVQELAGIEKSEIKYISDPVITEEVYQQRTEQPNHPWFNKDDPVIVSVGRQTYQKGYDILLEALSEVNRKKNTKLIVLGEESEHTPELRDKVQELDLEDSVDFHGYVNNPYSFMRASTIFVLSSRWEGGAHALIEALAAGSCIVATDCPTGTREILDEGNAGKLVPVEDVEAMSTAILELLEDPARRDEYAKAAQNRAKRFHSDEVAKQYISLINEKEGG